MATLLEKIQYWGLLLLVFFVPLFFLPITADFFDFNKQAFLVVGVVLLALVWAGRSVISGRLSLVATPFDLSVILLAAVFVLAAVLRTPNKMDAFLIPGTATIILALTLLYFLITQTIHDKPHIIRHTLYALLFSGLVVALVSIAAGTGLLENILQLPAWAQQKLFSLVGAPLPTVTFLAVLVILGVSQIFRASKERKPLFTIYYLLFTILFVLAIVAIAFQISPGKPATPRILPLSTGWAIAVETLKISPLGVGPGNFVSAFNQYRPLSYNQTDLWNLRFGASSNWYLQLFTEVGIIGLVVFLFLVWRIVRLGIRKQELGIMGNYRFIPYSLFFILLLFLVIPANLLLLITFYLLLGIAGSAAGREVTLRVTAGEAGQESERIAPVVALLAVLAVAVFVGIFGSRAYAAEITYKRALDAAARNDGTALYNLLIQTIQLNPQIDRYRISYSQANLVLANAIAQKKDITDQDRQTIAQLVQQTIREGQAAVALNNRLAGNWENLAGIYRALTPFAQGADQWALVSYSQAIAFDPINPILRLNLGGVHYAAGRFDEAIKSFELAVAAKPDWANAHFNLSAALREKGDIERATREMEQVLALVNPGTADYETAQKELANLRSKLPASPAGGPRPTPTSVGGETLQAPQPSPAPVIRPPLELPEEAAPPSTESGQ